MTVIAYRDGTLCSDSIAVEGDLVVGEVPKIFGNKKGYLAGACGTVSVSDKFIQWFMSGLEQEDMPELGEDLDGLLISPAGRIYLVGGGGVFSEMDASFLAIGSGSRVAMGAMEMGADALQAVRAAIKHVTSCGGEVQCLAIPRSVQNGI